MTSVFVDMLRSWQNFYFMAGGAAAALIGLMFVALSLGMHLVNQTTREQFGTFVQPSVVYFVSVLLLACVMLNPSFTQVIFACVLFFGGVVGLLLTVSSVRTLIKIAKKHQDFDTSEWLSQIILPVVNYGLIVFAGVCIGVNQLEMAFFELWLATILLLLSAILNTWSLVAWIVDQRGPDDAE